MKFIDYLKERWVTYTFILFAFLFFILVYKLDRNFNITRSNASYIIIGWIILFAIFIVSDYGIFNSRVKEFRRYCSFNSLSENFDEFVYPTDKEYAKLVNNLAVEFEKFKADIYNNKMDEQEFITKWVHDVKVPISAIRLIIENNEADMPGKVYQDVDMELFTIEQSVQRIFYEMKSNTFHDDYKIRNVSTKKLIADALKNYSSFFSYKKLNISIEGEAYEVLTDEKWSGYILSQILSNAVKYTPNKGTINITTTRIENETTISIKNTGKGILPEDIGQIFNKGYTSTEDRNGAKATGYGLYLSKKLSDLLGHRLTVESKYGEYAVFNLVFIENDTLINSV